MRHANASVVIALMIFSTAAASMPSVGQLLDHFAENADAHSASFMLKLESDRELVIDRTENPYSKPGKRQEHYNIDCR